MAVDVDALRGLLAKAPGCECKPGTLHESRCLLPSYSDLREAWDALPALLDELVALRAKLAESETMREANITYWQGVRDALVANNDRLREELASR